MTSEHDRSASTFVEPLPARPNLEMQHKRAKDLLRAAWAGDSDALTHIRALHPQPPALPREELPKPPRRTELESAALPVAGLYPRGTSKVPPRTGAPTGGR